MGDGFKVHNPRPAGNHQYKANGKEHEQRYEVLAELLGGAFNRRTTIAEDATPLTCHPPEPWGNFRAISP